MKDFKEIEFNDTGLCIPGRHYMADTSRKIEDIIRLVDKGKYFTINRPRQFGKTTISSPAATSGVSSNSNGGTAQNTTRRA